MGPFLLISFVDVSLQKRQLSKRKVTPQVVPQGLQECKRKMSETSIYFTPTPGVPSASPGPKTYSIPSKPIGLPIDFTKDL